MSEVDRADPPLARSGTAILVDVPLAAAFIALYAALGLGALLAGAALGGVDVSRRLEAFFGLDPTSAFNHPAFYLASVLLYAAVIAAVASVARVRAGRRWREWIAWAPFRAGASYWGIVAAAIVYGLAVSAVLSLLRPESRQWFIFPHDPWSVVLSFLLVVIFAPIAEELLFRGLLYGDLRPRFGALAAGLVSAALFAIAHWERTHLYALAVFPLGLLMVFVRERFGGTRASTLLHGLYNCSGWIAAALGSLGHSP